MPVWKNHLHCLWLLVVAAAPAWPQEVRRLPPTETGPLGSAATLHAALNIPNVEMIEAPWVNSDQKPDVVSPFPKVENGYALPLEGPGLGVAFDEKLARSRPFKPSALQPRLKALDGSVRDF